jgi:hypothetical protein
LFLDRTGYHPFNDQLTVPWIFIPPANSDPKLLVELGMDTLCYSACNFGCVIWPASKSELLYDLHDEFCCFNVDWLHNDNSVLSTKRWTLPTDREFVGSTLSALEDGEDAVTGRLLNTVAGYSKPGSLPKEEKEEAKSDGKKSKIAVVKKGAAVGFLRSDKVVSAEWVYEKLQ